MVTLEGETVQFDTIHLLQESTLTITLENGREKKYFM